MPKTVGRLAVLLLLLVPDLLVLVQPAPLAEPRPLDPATQRELAARKAERRARFNRSPEEIAAARLPEPAPYPERPTPVVVKGALVAGRPPVPGPPAAGGAPAAGLAAAEPGESAAQPAAPGRTAPDAGAALAAAGVDLAAELGRAWLEGEVLQPDGSAVPWLEVRLRADADGSVVAATVTDGEGSYRFPDLDPGRYRVEFGPAEAPLGRHQEPVEVRRGGYRRDFRAPRLGGLQVVVTAADGSRPLVGRKIRVQERFGEEREGVTDADGVARFRNLPVGSYRVLLIEDGVRVAEKRQAVVARAEPRVEFEV
ncbi:MAG: hypothetical protein D6702_08345 [Planctomycetota bacterium]|nr:MAG: hypothetical protein D6702_08345 [Planctomycetota bacterium]